MDVLVLGANGATGIHVVQQLLERGHSVKAMARHIEKLQTLKSSPLLTIIKGSILDIDKEILKGYLNTIDAVVSCLGHTISIQGIFGKPHRLVAEALKRVVEAIDEQPRQSKVKLVLMNSTACWNKRQNETRSFAESIVLAIVGAVLPPQKDNESALNYLQYEIGERHNAIEWVAVRPDALVDEGSVTEYLAYASAVRSPVFNAGKISRINVAHFMVRLISEEEAWEQWKYRTPVVYNKEYGNES